MFLFLKLRIIFLRLETFNYIDNVALYIESKDRRKNIDILQYIAKIAFN